MRRILSPGSIPDFARTIYAPKALGRFEFLVSAAWGALLGIVLLLDISLRFRMMFVAAVGFAVLFVIVKPRRRLVLFVLALVMPLSVGKYILSSDIAILPVHGVGIQLYDLLTVILLGLLLLRLAGHGRTDFRLASSITVPALVWLLASCFSLMNAKDWRLSSIELIDMGKLFVLYLAVANSIHDTQDTKWVIAGVMLALGFEAMLGVYQGTTGRYAGFSFLGEGAEVLQYSLEYGVSNRCEGTVCHPNALAMYLNTTLPFAVAVVLSRARKIYKAIAVVLIGIGVEALVLTLSRGGWVGFLLMVVVVLGMAVWRGRMKPGQALFIVSGCLVACVAVLIFEPNRITERLTSGDQGSAASRITMARGALAIMRDYPVLGAGVNNYTLYMRTYDPETYWENQGLYVVHNAYLLVGAETGLVGLTALVWFLASVIKQAWRSAGCNSDDTLWIVGAGVLGAYVSLCVHGSVDYALFGCPRVLSQFWFLAGVAAGGAGLTGQGIERGGREVI